MVLIQHAGFECESQFPGSTESTANEGHQGDPGKVIAKIMYHYYVTV